MRHAKTSHARFLTLALLAGLIALAGCGGGGEETETSPESAGGAAGGIESFGQSVGGAERAQAARTVEAYLGARAAGEWAKACSHFAEHVQQGLASLAENARGRAGKGCAGGAELLLSKAPKLRTGADVQVLALRVDGEKAFVIYRDGAGRRYSLPLIREGDEWKVISATPGIPLSP